MVAFLEHMCYNIHIINKGVLFMIISASRRTDVPAFHFEWFLRRLEAKEVLVRNPMNFNQVSRVDLSPELIDCIVFWTKNARPMLNKLDRLSKYDYYVQFTINPYDKDIETNLPPKDELLTTFKELSKAIGKARVIWRYSPVLLNEIYTEEYHYTMFEHFCLILKGYTNQCNLSFIEMYSKIKSNMVKANVDNMTEETKNRMALKFRDIAQQYDIELRACGNLDLEETGIKPAKCIDDEIISKITGLTFDLKKDKGQDKQCHCVTSVDIGTYNTCLNGCTYCYANCMSGTKEKIAKHNVNSKFLCSSDNINDKVTDRKVKKEGKHTLF